MELSMAAASLATASLISPRAIQADDNVLRSRFLMDRSLLSGIRNLKHDRALRRNVRNSVLSHSLEGWFAAVKSGDVERSGHDQEAPPNLPPMERRELMRNAVTLLMSSTALPALAASEGTEEGYTLFKNEVEKYSLLVPQEWAKGEGKADQRNVTAFYPENDVSANVNIVITGLGGDYTGLGSFGTAEMFAENLVNSLDRAWQKPPGQKARLVDDRSKNGMYYVEYTLQKPGEAQRHLLSVVGIANNGWYNRLYTVTAQYWEDDSDKYRTRLQKMVSSFRLT